MITRNHNIKISDYLLTFFSITVFSFFLFSLIYGAYINHSAVPFSDYWEGAVNFYLESQSNPAAWWHQHFDHRILLSKLIFWTDLRILGGQNLIYLPVHITLLLGLFGVYVAYARKLLPILFQRSSTIYCIVAISGLYAFSWMQRQNIIWEFQSQFILVYLLPLAAFYCFAHAKVTGDSSVSRYWLSGALLLGLASAHSMANGIVALPLLVFMGALLGLPKRQLIFIGSLAIISLAIFFIGYEKTPGQSFGPSLLIHQPLKLILFALAYLGNPFYLAFSSIPLSIASSLVALAIIVFIYYKNSELRKNPFSIALFTYIMYVVASAGLTAYGRALFSLEMAASSRYTTPSLTFWMATLLLLLAHFNSKVIAARLPGCILLTSFLVLIKSQLNALYYSPPVNWLPSTKQVAALSLQLNINDQSARRSLYPISDSRDLFFERARQAEITIFSKSVSFPADRLGKPVDPFWNLCQVNINKADLVDAGKKTYRISGEVTDMIKPYKYIFMADDDKVVKGIALLGQENLGDPGRWLPRLDWVLHPVNHSAFNGYLVDVAEPTAYCL